MRIHRAIKTAAVAKQIKEAIAIADKAGIHGVEIQEIFPLVIDLDLEKRTKIILDSFGDYPIKKLVYHYPLRASYESFEQAAEELDLSYKDGNHCLRLVEETIKEAGYAGRKLGLPKAIVNIHLIGLVKPEEIIKDELEKKLKIGEKRLEDVKKIADHYSDKYGCRLIVTRENNPPDHDVALGILDFDPRDTVRTIGQGIYANLDFAHAWLCELYRKNGKGEFPGVDLSVKLHQELGLGDMAKTIAPAIRLLHMNDAGPDYNKEFEGLEIGTGTVPHREVIESVLGAAKEDIVGTYEIRYGHIDPETMFRSDKKYREIFGDKFFEYFN